MCTCAGTSGGGVTLPPAPAAAATSTEGGGAPANVAQDATQQAADKATKGDDAKPAKPKQPTGGGDQARRGVLLIGDSLTVGTKQYFTEQLAGQPVQVNATGGISLAEGMRRYDATKNKPRVVEMALFTNNSPGQQGELRKAIERTIQDARERGGKVVWATIVRPGNYGPVNEMIREYARRNPDVMGLVDWAKMVQQHPNYLAGDKIHGTAAGYKARAQAFADAAK